MAAKVQQKWRLVEAFNWIIRQKARKRTEDS